MALEAVILHISKHLLQTREHHCWGIHWICPRPFSLSLLRRLWFPGKRRSDNLGPALYLSLFIFLSHSGAELHSFLFLLSLLKEPQVVMGRGFLCKHYRTHTQTSHLLRSLREHIMVVPSLLPSPTGVGMVSFAEGLAGCLHRQWIVL